MSVKVREISVICLPGLGPGPLGNVTCPGAGNRHGPAFVGLTVIGRNGGGGFEDLRSGLFTVFPSLYYFL
jgi:hypothetical protein